MRLNTSMTTEGEKKLSNESDASGTTALKTRLNYRAFLKDSTRRIIQVFLENAAGIVKNGLK